MGDAVHTNIYWITGPWKGRLGIASHPRGGERLSPELESWRDEGANALVSLLTPEEIKELALDEEATIAAGFQFNVLSFPITDRSVPKSGEALETCLGEVAALLDGGSHVVIHCRQGIGRSGLVASCLLTREGIAADHAIERVQRARGMFVPDTEEQRHWIREHAHQRRLLVLKSSAENHHIASK